LVNAQGIEGKLDDARQSAERLVALERKLSGEASWMTGNALRMLGSAYVGLGQDDRGLECEQRALAIEVSLLGNEHPDLAGIENGIASVLYDRAKYAEAESHFRRAVHLLDQSNPLSSDYADALNNLGSDLSDQGRYEEALAMHHRALTIQGKILPADHPDVVYALAGIGRAYLGLKDPRRALPFLERALTARVSGDPIPLAETKFLLATALADAGGDVGRAKTLAVEARSSLQISAKQPSDLRLLAEVKAWLASHTGTSPVMGTQPK
jgi:tetratricopeptide (TPR) repeat protein